MKAIGWILDVYIGDRNAVLWVKLDNGKTVRLTDSYRPDFYVELKDGFKPEDVSETIALHPHVHRVKVEEKYTSILHREKSRVIHVFTSDTSSFRVVKDDLERLNFVKSWFNVDLYHFQRYLFSKTFAPTSKVEIEWSGEGKLENVAVLNDSADVCPPPFSAMVFEVSVSSEKLTPDVRIDHIERISLHIGEGEAETLEGDEATILSRFASRLKELNPDFLVAKSCEETLRYIFERARILGMVLQLGRESNKSYISREMASAVRGRAIADLGDFLEFGVAGICELSRFTLAPPSFSAKWPAGKTIDARQSYEALKKDILVPKKRGFPRFVMTADEIDSKDKGGLLFSPVVGLHENVAELDFESTYPNIIILHNISYETVTPTSVDKTRQGFLGEVVKIVLDRRLRFKHLRKKYPKDSREYEWCDQRQKALKMVLVCIYGFSGCFANRFNNVAAYNEINATSRRILVQAVNICMARGFEVLYGNVDSLFIKRLDASREDYEMLSKTIQEETGLPISVDNHYRFIVFMRQETHPDVECMNHFFGKLTDGGFNCRGIDLRRRDCPPFIKKFQKKLMEILFDAENCNEVVEKRVAEAKAYTRETYSKVMRGEVDAKELVISKRVHKDVRDYRSMFPHVVAARQMTTLGKKLKEFSSVDFVFMNSEHRNPLRRVIPLVMVDDGCNYYDRKKYGKLILDVADTILKTLNVRHIQVLNLDALVGN
ncbi:MAG: DNA-directed polymerase [Thermoproteota archaeon]|nr:DNA-directed polymerase [Thermoproteota archaeon]